MNSKLFSRYRCAIVLVAVFLLHPRWADAQFDQVINVPSDPAPTSIGDGTQLNVYYRGRIGDDFVSTAGSEINIYDGRIGYDFHAFGTSLNMYGGKIYNGFTAQEGSKVYISGGRVYDDLHLDESTLTLTENATLRNLIARSESTVNMYGGDTRDLSLLYSTANLHGGTLYNLDANFSEIIVSGATIDSRSILTDSVIRVLEGNAGRVDLRGSSQLTMGGGTATVTEVQANSKIFLRSGTVRVTDILENGAVLTQSGGVLDSSLKVRTGGVVNLSGGGVSPGFASESSGEINIFGDHFSLNGEPYTGSTITLQEGDYFSGALLDGSVFLFSPEDDDRLEGVNLMRTPTPFVDFSAMTVSHGTTGRGLLPGQSLTLRSTGSLPNKFAVVEAELTMEGGTATDIEAWNSDLVFTDGQVTGTLMLSGNTNASFRGGVFEKTITARAGTTVEVSGGNFRSSIISESGSHLNISGGGSIARINSQPGSQTTILSGAYVGETFTEGSSDLNIHGGRVRAIRGDANLYGGDFYLDGKPIEGLGTPGNTITLADIGDSLFTGTLSDGTPFVYSKAVGNIGYYRQGQVVTGKIRLQATELPASTPLIDVNGESDQLGIRAGETLFVKGGGSLGDHFIAAPQSKLIVEPGGTVGDELELFASELIVRGTVGNGVNAFLKTPINIEGGTIGSGLHLHENGTLNVNGGEVGGDAVFGRGSHVILQGNATFGGGTLEGGSTMTIHSGTVTRAISVNAALVGYVDEVPIIERAKLELKDGQVDSLTAASGIIELRGGTVENVQVRPNGIARMYEGATIENIEFKHHTGTLEMHGGTINDNIVGMYLTSISIAGGVINGYVETRSVISFDMSGGMIEGNLVPSGSGSTYNLSGGSIHGFIHSDANIKLNLIGHRFAIDGVPVEGLNRGPLTINERDVTLSGVLADGTPFNYQLNSTSSVGGRGSPWPTADYFHPSTTITISLVPEPATLGVFLAALFGVGFWKRAHRSAWFEK